MTRNYTRITLALVFFTVILSACSPGSYNPILKSKYDRITDTLRYVDVVSSNAPSSLIYRIQPADMLSIRNIKIEEITDGGGGGQSGGGQNNSQNSSGSSGGFRVEDDGTVNLPEVGKVYVKGLTRKEATDKLQDLYKSKLLKNPILDVSVADPRVTIIGEVNAPGVYSLNRENTSLLEVIGMAGGLSTKVKTNSLKIIRGDKLDPEIIYVNLEHLESITDPRVILQNRDVVYVETDRKYSKFEKSQSGISIFQTILVVASTGLLIFTTFIK